MLTPVETDQTGVRAKAITRPAPLAKMQSTSSQLLMAGPIVLAIGLLSLPSMARAHQWHTHAPHKSGHSNNESSNLQHPDDSETQTTASEPSTTTTAAAAAQAGKPGPVSLAGPLAVAFDPFPRTVSAHVDGQYLVVESNGLPRHQMMVGIVSWQQQVPLPQPFTGDNAWRLPLHPKPAETPISVLTEPLGGAIALAVNGVPIFCALNNRGEDTLLAGELDQWGGHCGRGDDYHYHAAPVHLEKHVGVGNPIGYALDGYPILGFTEADGSPPTDLDEFNGHKDAAGNYHYHATKTFPYINGGLKGIVTMDGSQVKQPRDSPTRPSLQPLPGATITGFSQNGNHYDLEYEVEGKKSHVKYSLLDDDQVEFSFVDHTGTTSTALYQRGQGRPNGSAQIYLIGGLLCAGFLATIVLARRFRRTPDAT